MALAFAVLGTAICSRAFAQCLVDDPRAVVMSVSVSTPGAEFELDVWELPVQVRPKEGEARARVDVLAPLRFSGSVLSEDLDYHLDRAIDLYDGRIRLGAGARPSWHGVQGNAMLANVEKTMFVSVAQPLAVRCSHLDLHDGGYRTPEATVAPQPGIVGTGGEVPFYRFPTAIDPILVRYPGAFLIESRRPGWVLLRASWEDGSRLRGWTPAENARAEPDGNLIGFLSTSSYCLDCKRDEALELTAFTLRKGAPISAAPGVAPWAHTTARLAVEAFPVDRADGWIRIGAVAGLAKSSDPCAPHERLWVHASDLLWPKQR